MKSFEAAMEWAAEEVTEAKVALLLGNGFSIAYDSTLFTYTALATRAQDENLLPPIALKVMTESGRADFESVMRQLQLTLDTLVSIDPMKHRDLITEISEAIVFVREALASAVAGLHPNRPYDIPEESYRRVRSFLDRFTTVYTVSYDLLTYWALRQDFNGLAPRISDDGFRDSGIDTDETVLWDIYNSFSQNVHYLHGALHLYEGRDGLRKITYARTNDPLIDQIRRQLEAGRYPLYVAEGESEDKLARINGSAYLSRSLRSLSGRYHSLVVFGHSLDRNDDHVFEAIVRSKITRLAVSIHGDIDSPENQLVVQRTEALKVRRTQRRGKPLETIYFDAGTVPLWHP
jgi:hypothetical protein